jgi:hypothetical protein
MGLRVPEESPGVVDATRKRKRGAEESKAFNHRKRKRKRKRCARRE